MGGHPSNIRSFHAVGDMVCRQGKATGAVAETVGGGHPAEGPVKRDFGGGIGSAVTGIR